MLLMYLMHFPLFSIVNVPITDLSDEFEFVVEMMRDCKRFECIFQNEMSLN